MDSVYEDVRSILENRRIRSEILQEQKNEQIRQQYPELAKIEKEIEDTTEQLLLNSLDGKSSEDLERELRILNRKKENILASCGIAMDEFEAKPYCSKCGDTGYIHETGKDGSEKVTLCECIRSLIAPVMLSRSGVEKYPGYSFEKGSDEFFSSDPRMLETYTKLKLLTEKERIPNAVFYGRSGKGKTFTAVAIARKYAQKGRSSFVIRLAEAQELMMEHRKMIQAFYTPADKERAVEQKVDYLTEADLLVLDDLGVEPRTANTEADLLNLLDKRSLAGKTTIITTNFDMESLKERYGGRFFDRIDRNFARFHFSMEGSRT
jgi:DNA replication protein DnaC